ncbi:MAG: lipoprotein [Halomonas sp.]|jgi:predicted small lipoprotein YifL|uniref:Lipoprotein n=1 Tax=Vreelandella janggokensis TaxID=370767 RepID=A0ABT4IWG2_9GAMM|nr:MULTISPECIES: lipoprotein [Halomonas]MCA1772704.1 lipoprotein [Halomonas sp.]KPQ30942.1 MAG: Prokaryotic lipoprotein-attachment site [Halomonas sp. HL-93]MCO7245975.1 lipoprotein [Halomonas sp. Mc5H-6]MCW4150798.1 lipoprotein [Halomonas sp. 18H]MCZ0927488.1 lipoprotein [Halomonas janggokensis]
MKKIALLAVVALLLVGCGQKGPLYLPDDDNVDQQEG